MTTHTNTLILITGANRGIGLSTARALGARDGRTILIGARHPERGRQAAQHLRADGVDAREVTLDVTDDESIAAAERWIDAEFGRLDVLINNAGIALADGRGVPSQTTRATMRAVFETNVFGVVAVTNAMLPLLRRSAAGRIVNVSSEVGSITTMTDPASPFLGIVSVPYPASKAALNMVTAMYAKELAGDGIMVNAANPGYTRTEFNHNSGYRTPEQGAEPSVYLATVAADGPNGILWGDLAMQPDGGYGQLPW